MPIAISLSPNTDFSDVKLAVKLLFVPWQWQKGKATRQVEEKIKKYLGFKEAITFANGRQSLLAILKCFNLQKGDEVLLQTYTCVVVPNSIIAAGTKPVYVDIDPGTFNLDINDLKRKITSQSKVLIVQHTFGQPAQMAEIIRVAKENHLIIIEDAAHALGAEYQGRKVGTFSDAAFFSFGRDKVISSVFGGVVVTNNKKLAEKLKQIREKASYPCRCWILQQLLHPLVFHLLVLPLYFFFSLGKIILVIFQKLNLLSKAVTSREKMSQDTSQIFRYPNALACLCLPQLEKLDEMNRQRRKIAKIYSRELRDLPLKLPQIKKDCYHIFLRYTIKIDKADELTRFAKNHKILLGDWYRPVIAPVGVDFKKVFYQKGSCPQAEKAAAMSVNLPTYSRMSLSDAERVVRVTKEFCRREL